MAYQEGKTAKTETSGSAPQPPASRRRYGLTALPGATVEGVVISRYSVFLPGA